MNLQQLAEQKEYNTDKNTTHTYLEAYDEVFAPFKSKTVNILEIGNNGGGSIDIWDDYFDDAQIYGLEINDLACLHKLNERDNIHIKMGVDAYTHGAINQFFQEGIRFDIIIDDGSHLPQHQFFVLTQWMPMLKDGGVMVIEDIQNFDLVNKILSATDLDSKNRVKIFDRRNIKKRFDDIMIVINKG